MPDTTLAPPFTKLVQSFFAEHLVQQRALSPRTVAAYRDTFRLLLTFAEKTIGKSPTRIRLVDINAKLVWLSLLTSKRCGKMPLAVAMPGWRPFDLF